MTVEDKTIVQFRNASGQLQNSRPVAGGFARPTPGGKGGARPVPPPPPQAPVASAQPSVQGGMPWGTTPGSQVIPDLENPLLGAARELIQVMAQLATQTESRDSLVFRDWAVQQIQRFEHQCLQLDVHEEIRFFARYVLCTVLDELVIKTPWGSDGVWSRQSLLSQFHGETNGGDRFFQLLEYLQQAPARNLHLLELMYVCMGLGFEGKFKLDQRGYAQLETIRDNLFHLLRRQKGEPERDLSPHWQRVTQRRNKLASYFPWWVVAAVIGVIMLGAYSGFSWLLAEKNQQILSRLERPALSVDKQQ
ncbi:MAG: type IVB secretion system protein IcmH/DotU [Gammaproteobacteria bacterium]